MRRDSRRARLVLVVLLLTALSLLTLDYRVETGASGSPVDGLRRAAGTLLGPVERAVGRVTRPVGNAVSGLAHLSSYSATLTRLRKDNDVLRHQVQQDRLDDGRGQQLLRLFRLAGLGQYRVVPAQVVAIGRSLGFEWTATLDVGSRDRVARDMTVINGDGLVGRVEAVTASTATVSLVIDPKSSVGARVESSLQIGFTTGNSAGPLTLRLLSANARLSRGDRLVTLGSPQSRPYVPGVPIGTVSVVQRTPGALTRTALVTPYVDFTALDLVGVVIAPPRVDPRFSTLPPRPTPTGRARPAPRPPAPRRPAPRTPTPRRTPVPSATPAAVLPGRP